MDKKQLDLLPQPNWEGIDPLKEGATIKVVKRKGRGLSYKIFVKKLLKKLQQSAQSAIEKSGRYSHEGTKTQRIKT